MSNNTSKKKLLRWFSASLVPAVVPLIIGALLDGFWGFTFEQNIHRRFSELPLVIFAISVSLLFSIICSNNKHFFMWLLVIINALLSFGLYCTLLLTPLINNAPSPKTKNGWFIALLVFMVIMLIYSYIIDVGKSKPEKKKPDQSPVET